jgi:hypothetical protein
MLGMNLLVGLEMLLEAEVVFCLVVLRFYYYYF